MEEFVGRRPRVRVVHPEGGRVMTKQSDALKTDVNHILERWVSHGQVPRGGGNPTYGDFSQGLDFHAALSQVRVAEEHFERLPAHIRKHVHNDPGEFLDLVMDEARRPELEELGLVPELVPAAIAPVPAEPAVPGVPEPVAEGSSTP